MPRWENDPGKLCCRSGFSEKKSDQKFSDHGSHQSREREIRERKVPLLELTKDRVVPLAGVYDRGNDVVVGVVNDDVNEGSDDVATTENTEQRGHIVHLEGIEILADEEAQALVADKPKKFRKRKTVDGAGGSGLPPKKLEWDHGTSGDAGTITVGKSLAALQDLLDKSTLATEIGVTAATTLPFVTSFVTPTGACRYFKSSGYLYSVTQEVNEPTHASIFTDSTSAGNVDLDAVGPSQPAGNDISSESFYVSLDMDSEALRHAYVPKWTKFNVEAARQTCLSTEVRMHLEHVLKGKKRLEGRCVLQEKLLKEKDVEIADLKARLSLKEVEAKEVTRLHGQIADVEAAEAARACELESLKERNVALESVAVAKDVEIAKLSQDYHNCSCLVSTLEATCSGLRDEVSGYKLFKERIE
nr:hypothetical protein [Tanacetum cinerariifolium]